MYLISRFMHAEFFFIKTDKFQSNLTVIFCKFQNFCLSFKLIALLERILYFFFFLKHNLRNKLIKTSVELSETFFVFLLVSFSFRCANKNFENCYGSFELAIALHIMYIVKTDYIFVLKCFKLQAKLLKISITMIFLHYS